MLGMTAEHMGGDVWFTLTTSVVGRRGVVSSKDPHAPEMAILLNADANLPCYA